MYSYSSTLGTYICIHMFDWVELAIYIIFIYINTCPSNPIAAPLRHSTLRCHLTGFSRLGRNRSKCPRSLIQNDKSFVFYFILLTISYVFLPLSSMYFSRSPLAQPHSASFVFCLILLSPMYFSRVPLAHDRRLTLPIKGALHCAH